MSYPDCLDFIGKKLFQDHKKIIFIIVNSYLRWKDNKPQLLQNVVIILTMITKVTSNPNPNPNSKQLHTTCK